MDQLHAPDRSSESIDVGRNYRNAIARLDQRHQCGRRTALQQNGRVNVGDIASSVEPSARAKSMLQQQQRFVRELNDIDYGAASKPVLLREYGENVDGIQRSPVEPLFVTGRHDRQVNVAALKLTAAIESALKQLDRDARVSTQIVH
jgi:hypothetical protein